MTTSDRVNKWLSYIIQNQKWNISLYALSHHKDNVISLIRQKIIQFKFNINHLISVTCSNDIDKVSSVAFSYCQIPLVLSEFKTNLFIFNHLVCKYVTQHVDSLWALLILAEQDKVESSAYRTTSAFLTTYGKSFMKTENKNGPKKLPCAS